MRNDLTFGHASCQLFGIAQLRRELKDWLERARSGDEVIITDRGTPVARLLGVDVPSHVQRLIADGHLSEPRQARPRATGRSRASASGEVVSFVSADRELRRE